MCKHGKGMQTEIELKEEKKNATRTANRNRFEQRQIHFPLLLRAHPTV